MHDGWKRLKHFEFLDATQRTTLFQREPRDFDVRAGRDELATFLGATLYVPAGRRDLSSDARRARRCGVTSMVLCLEDSIPDREVAAATGAVVASLLELAPEPDERPLTFVRVRAPEQIPALVARLDGNVGALAGFVLPKFDRECGAAYLNAVAAAPPPSDRPWWIMPILETADVMYAESRVTSMVALRDMLRPWADSVLAVRIGATDLSAFYGVRRPPELSIYDLPVVAAAIGDAVNIFARRDGTGFPVSGPVWEYFAPSQRVFKPQLRQTPFSSTGTQLRQGLLDATLDGLVREAILDRSGGMTGKSVIHPTHVAPVHAFSVVTDEEHADALDILRHDKEGGGVTSSQSANKMNEAGPHREWARTVSRRADAFGVAAPGVDFADLLGAIIGA